MKAARIPTIVYAFIDDKWRQVISIVIDEPYDVVVAYEEDKIEMYPQDIALKWDLLWPKGML